MCTQQKHTHGPPTDRMLIAAMFTEPQSNGSLKSPSKGQTDQVKTAWEGHPLGYPIVMKMTFNFTQPH